MISLDIAPAFAFRAFTQASNQIAAAGSVIRDSFLDFACPLAHAPLTFRQLFPEARVAHDAHQARFIILIPIHLAVPSG